MNKRAPIRTSVLVAGTLITMLFSSLALARPAFLRSIDSKIVDILLRSTGSPGSGRTPAATVIVDIDDKSIGQYGQWPWPRNLIALLLERINELSPSSVGLDLLFLEPDRTSLAQIQKAIKNNFNISIGFVGIQPKFMDNDRILASALAKGPFILGNYFGFTSSSDTVSIPPYHPVNSAIRSVQGGRNSISPFIATSSKGSLSLLAEAAPLSGFTNIIPDEDGVIRRSPLLIRYQDRLYPSLALAAIMKSMGTGQIVLDSAPDASPFISVKNISIPVDNRGNLLIRFQGTNASYEHISAADVLKGSVSPERLKGRIVLLGASAVGLDGYRTTPMGHLVPAMDIHAAVIHNILNQHFLKRPVWASGLELALLLVCGLGSTIVLAYRSPMASLGIILAGGMALYGTAITFANHGIVISPLLPVITLVATFSLLNFLRYWLEEHRFKERSRELSLAQSFTISCLAALTETRDSETGGHIIRCQEYVKTLTHRLVLDPYFSDNLDNETVELMHQSATLHDIGKVGIPDSILLKPGRLTHGEYQEMKNHARYGLEAIKKAESRYGMELRSTFLELGKQVTYTHHEKWDGTGYPEGISGESIPLIGRIMAIADAYDALITTRRYKQSVSHEEAVEIIMHDRGTHFDPRLVDIFCEAQDDFRRIAFEFPD